MALDEKIIYLYGNHFTDYHLMHIHYTEDGVAYGTVEKLSNTKRVGYRHLGSQDVAIPFSETHIGSHRFEIMSESWTFNREAKDRIKAHGLPVPLIHPILLYPCFSRFGVPVESYTLLKSLDDEGVKITAPREFKKDIEFNDSHYHVFVSPEDKRVDPEDILIVKTLGTFEDYKKVCACCFVYKDGVMSLRVRSFLTCEAVADHFEMELGQTSVRYFETPDFDELRLMNGEAFPVEKMDLSLFDPEEDTVFEVFPGDDDSDG